MKPRTTKKHEPKADKSRKAETKPRLQIVRLESRITPGFALNHNETLVREPEKTARKSAETRTAEPKPKLRVLKLEPRIAPSNANFPPGQFPSGNP
jgi:hypothetical protein